jgi:hypothetical protein
MTFEFGVWGSAHRGRQVLFYLAPEWAAIILSGALIAKDVLPIRASERRGHQ